MSDIIQLLPDSVANQIAAGEVIQRPASVVKELVENAIDAGATEIKIQIKDGGRSLIQVVDNGKGMSDTDARMAFERHATSKIRKADDLFAILSMGFRGEALASIAAIAQIELKTRQEQDTLGNLILISGSNVEKHEQVACPVGSNFQVKNLFFNVPARRKFLKQDSTEYKHIVTVFQRIVLTYPNVAFTLVNNNVNAYVLPKSDLLQRILHVQGKNLSKSLTPIETQTTMVNISGYIGKPEFARKSNAEQFFFVNSRYMKHPYFHKAVMLAYQDLIPSDVYPSYFIYFEMDPANIDINIHPTKTEINFENSPAIFQIIRASVKEAIGKFNIAPSIDFNQDGAIDMPYLFNKTEMPPEPQIKLQSGYNPFEQNQTSQKPSQTYQSKSNNENVDGWEKLYEAVDRRDFHQQYEQSTMNSMEKEAEIERKKVFQLKKHYIVTPVKSGAMIIDQKRAHERILFDYFSQKLAEPENTISQQTLFPINIELNEADDVIFQEINPHLKNLGFDINEFGKRAYVVNGAPPEVETQNVKKLIEKLIAEYHETENVVGDELRRKLVLSFAKSSAIDYGRELSVTEMQDLIDNLLSCPIPNYTEDGKMVIHIVSYEDLLKKFD